MFTPTPAFAYAVLFVLFVLYITNRPRKIVVSPETLNFVKQHIERDKIFIVAKSYCPHCRATMQLLFEDLRVPRQVATVLLVDQIENGQEIQDAMTQITGQKTVPNIFIGKQHIGGNSDLQKLHQTRQLRPLLQRIVNLP